MLLTSGLAVISGAASPRGIGLATARPFAAHGARDATRLAITEEKLDAKIVCALPGLTTGCGPSHQATEDIATSASLCQRRSYRQ